MLLFVCLSLYQLISFINLKVNKYPDTPTDLVLARTTDLTGCAEAIRKTGLFDEVIMTEWGNQGDRGCFGKTLQENTACMKNAKNHPYAMKTGKKYTDIFCCGVVHSYIYLLYYQMVGEGVVPSVHLVEDGSSSYMEDIIGSKMNGMDDGFIDHSVFPENARIYSNITESLLYEPTLFSSKKKSLAHNPLPKSQQCLEKLRPFLYQIFGKPDLPEERYIFFNEPLAFAEGKNSNELDILDHISEIVGKESIVVRVHPRCRQSQFELHGYKTMPVTDTPWEVFASLGEISDKVLMAISSDCLFTPNVVFGSSVNSIYLNRIMSLSRSYCMCLENADTYFDKMYRYLNSNTKQMFVPRSFEELDCCVKYLEGKL